MEMVITENLIQVISDNERNFLGDSNLTSFENAIREFDELVEKGFAKKRENNLLSFTDSHLHRITLGTFKNKFIQQTFCKNGTEAHSLNFSTKTNFDASSEF